MRVFAVRSHSSPPISSYSPATVIPLVLSFTSDCQKRNPVRVRLAPPPTKTHAKRKRKREDVSLIYSSVLFLVHYDFLTSSQWTANTYIS